MKKTIMPGYPESVLVNGQEVNVAPTCPHFDGTCHNVKTVAKTHDDRIVRKAGKLGKNRVIIATLNQTIGLDSLDPEVRKSVKIMSLAEIMRKAVK